MNKPYIFVKSKQYEEHSKIWLKWLNYDESVVITFPYLNDRAIRIKQFCDYIKDNEYYNPIIFDPNTDFFDEYIDLKKYVDKNHQKDKKSIMVIPNGDSFLLPQNIKYFEYLERYRTENIANFNTLMAFESDFQTKVPGILTYTLLFQNLDFYPLYNNLDVERFIDSCLTPTWDVQVPVVISKQILEVSGGSFWLAKEAVRIYRDSGSFNALNPAFVSKLNSIASTLSPNEQKILLSAPKLHNYKNTQEYIYLKHIGYLSSKDECASPLLLEYIRSNYSVDHALRIVGEDIYLDKLNVSIMLSKNENAILKGLMQKPNEPFTRDEIAKVIWEENAEDRYSAWAIDQAAKRLRDKLVKLGLPATTIKSIRGVGYEYRS